MSRFKVGDKVYFPMKTQKILTLELNPFHRQKGYILLAGGVSFNEDGGFSPNDKEPSIYHATSENHALLEQMHGIEFENPSVDNTSGHVGQAASMANGIWVDVKDQLPPDDSSVMVYVNGDIRIFGYVASYLVDTRAHWWVDESGDFHSDIADGDVTHWMLLPQPPNKEHSRYTYDLATALMLLGERQTAATKKNLMSLLQKYSGTHYDFSKLIEKINRG